MKLLKVLIERSVQTLNRPFTYAYFGNKTVDVGYRVLVPFAKGKDLVAYVLEVIDTNQSLAEIENESGFKISTIKEVIDDKPLLNDSLMELAKEISEYYLSPLIAVLQTMLPTSLKPRGSALNGPKIAYDIYVVCINEDENGLTAKQVELLRLIKESGQMLKREIKQKSVLQKLAFLGRVKEIKKEAVRLVLPSFDEEIQRPLTFDQQKAFESIIKTDKVVSLLQGVTGSGKTEVYLALSDYYIKQNRTVLMLVPEISLTPLMCKYFLRRFKNNVAILHSELTDAEKYDEYRRIAKGEVQIVVGTRSAIFAPLKNIGLIILDEEHVESYKQDNLPCYHAREVAIMRAKKDDAKVVLGSATPSLESKARGDRGVYNLVKLNKRVNEKELPKTTIVDMSNYGNYYRESSIFSRQLIDALKRILDRHEQAILLINKRGFSSSVYCRSCGYIFKCPNCGIPLTYHKKNNMLKCHHCEYVSFKEDTCPECGSKYLSTSGYGTEKIVEEVNKLFPNTRCLRLDSDVGKIRNNIAKTLKSFANLDADILVGTQMIAKGHDFPNVTLVGVVSADVGLSLPSFRSTERVFELITQAVGRAGRQDKEGQAIVQTFNPKHYAVTCAANQDYESFYVREMNVRKTTQYPPYTYLACIDVSSQSEETVIDLANSLANRIVNEKMENINVLGPVSPYISFQNKYHHRLILVKYKNSDKIKKYLSNLIASLKGNTRINIKVDIDPYSV